MTTRFVAYYRVSTDRQGQSGLGLEAQASAVARYVERIGAELVAEVTEIESGRRDDRPELARALGLCRSRRAVLLIARLDRLSRNVAFIANLMDSGADFRAVDMPEASRLTLHILASVAEHEREMISARTKSALAVAKARGVRLGSPNPGYARATASNVVASNRFAQTHWPLIESLAIEGLSLRAIAREMNERKLRTRTGKDWTAVQVRNIMKWARRT
jgi:DNA invertase Pin-like site-specific DNA recombinase